MGPGLPLGRLASPTTPLPRFDPGLGPGIPFFLIIPSKGIGVPPPGVLPGTGVPFDSEAASAGDSSAVGAGVETEEVGDFGGDGTFGVTGLGAN